MVTHLEAVAAEVATADGPVLVPFRDGELSVPNVKEWTILAVRALREGDFATWAEKVMDAADSAVFLGADPKMTEVTEFFDDWNKATGQDTGKSSASTKSSKRTAKR